MVLLSFIYIIKSLENLPRNNGTAISKPNPEITITFAISGLAANYAAGSCQLRYATLLK